MRTRLLTLLIPLLLPAFVVSGQHAEKTLVKGFNLSGHQVIYLDLDGEVEVQQWDQEQMQVRMVITLQNGTDVILKSLLQVGRYNLQSEEKGEEFVIFAPNLAREVKMKNGQDLGEKISYQIYAPGSVLVKTKNNIESTGMLTTSSF